MTLGLCDGITQDPGLQPPTPRIWTAPPSPHGDRARPARERSAARAGGPLGQKPLRTVRPSHLLQGGSDAGPVARGPVLPSAVWLWPTYSLSLGLPLPVHPRRRLPGVPGVRAARLPGPESQNEVCPHTLSVETAWEVGVPGLSRPRMPQGCTARWPLGSCGC